MSRGAGELQVEGYRVLHEIGHGGFSTVLLAEEVAAGRRVALKVATAGDPTTQRRFATEAAIGQSWASTSGVVGVLRLTAASDGRPVLVLPYYDRGTAAQFLAPERRLPHSAVADIVRQVAQGLDAMHRQHYVHRDVSPRNVLRSGELGYAIGDLGCTRPSNSIEQPPWTEALTPGYAAPEANDETRAQTFASDVYGLAATTWALFTGDAPGPRPSIQTLLDVGVPPSAAGILVRALDPDPARRPARVLDLADALAPLAPAPATGIGPMRPARSDAHAVPDSTHLVGVDRRSQKQLPPAGSRRPLAIGVVIVLACFVLGYLIVAMLDRSPSSGPEATPTPSVVRTASSIPTTPPPAAVPVSDLHVTGVSSGSVTLAWTPPADPGAKPQVDWSVNLSGGDRAWLAGSSVLAAGTASTTVNPPDVGGDFCFRLSVYQEGEFTVSNEVCPEY